MQENKTATPTWFSTLKRYRDALAEQTGLRFQLPISYVGRHKENWLSDAGGVQELSDIQTILKDIPVKVDNKLDTTINVLLPTLDPKVLFGGYIAMLNFLGRLRQRGHRLRIILCDRCESRKEINRIRDGVRNHPLISENLGPDTELHLARHVDGLIAVGPEDACISYSWVTAYLAHSLSEKTSGKPFVYFIQEYEPIFYPNNSFRAMAEGAYELPHNAVFNSAILTNFFKGKSIGLFHGGAGNDRHITFEQALSRVRRPTVDDLEKSSVRKLLFYARPENHAARNIFAVGMLAIKEAVARGLFDEEEWEFYGIGSISFRDTIDLGHGRVLKMLPRMGQDEYAEKLSSFDLGLSLMYAPHPSVPPFEMAAAGMPTITNAYEGRSESAMQERSPNLIISRSNPDSIADGLAVAIRRVRDYTGRVHGADFQYCQSWAETFSDEFMAKFERLII